MAQQSQAPHIAILVSPGMGHLIPALEFSKRLVNLHSFHVTYIIPTIGPPPDAMKEVLEVLPPALTHHFIPFHDIPKDVSPWTRMSLTMTRSLPSIRALLKSLMTASNTRLVALVVDLFSTEAFDLADELDIPPYVFFAPNAMSMSFCFHLLDLLHDTDVDSGELKGLPDQINIPGFSLPVPTRDLPITFAGQNGGNHEWFLYHCKRYRLAKGVVVNSFVDMEPGAFKALKQAQENGTVPPVFLVGPVIRTGSSGPSDDGSHCLEWLDSQPRGSVLFVSFGSGGTLSYCQIQELALGLEMSGQRFLWVVRHPNDEGPHGAYFGDGHSQNDPLSYLPSGFLDRTKGVGLVVPSWAPQAQVLSHGSTGGFLSHCGWNSTLESVANGVPIVAWPLYAEQKMNALMLTDVLHVALRPKANENGVVVREEIARVVQSLIAGGEGDQMRRRMNDLKDAAANALKEDGSSTKALSEFASKFEDFTGLII